MRGWQRDLLTGMATAFVGQLALRAADALWDRWAKRGGDGDGDETGTVATETCSTCGHERECQKGQADRVRSGG